MLKLKEAATVVTRFFPSPLFKKFLIISKLGSESKDDLG